MELIKQVNGGCMFMNECELCNKYTQIFQPAESCRKLCIICIISKAGVDDNLPCMNCVYYGFVNYNGTNFPGNGFGKCCQCINDKRLFGVPAPPAYQYVISYINKNPANENVSSEKILRQADNGLLYYGQCELCDRKSQIFQPNDSNHDICLYCIIKNAAANDNYMPCLNCVYYGFNDPDHPTHPGDGFGRCYNCDLFQSPKIQVYYDKISIDMYKFVLDKITNLPSLDHPRN